MVKLNCIIIEDEKPAQEVLKSFISKTEWINLMAIFGDAIEALDFLKRNDVDFIFLDIQIPGITGFEFLKIVKSEFETFLCVYFIHYPVKI